MKYRCFECAGKGGGFLQYNPSSFPVAQLCKVCGGKGCMFTPALAKRLKCSASSLYRIEDAHLGGGGEVAARILPAVLSLAKRELRLGARS